MSTTSTPAVATASVPGEITAISAPPRRVRRQQRRTTTAKHLRANLTAYLMLTPMVVLLAIFVIWPLIYAVYLSLHRISFYKPPKYVGLQFYQYVLTDPGVLGVDRDRPEVLRHGRAGRDDHRVAAGEFHRLAQSRGPRRS